MMHNRRQIFLLFIVVFVFFQFAWGQTDTTGPRITGTFRNIIVDSFLQKLTLKTGYQFYYTITDFDSALVDLSVTNEPLQSVLRLAFSKLKLGLLYSEDSEHHIFITKNARISTKLPDDFFDDQMTRRKQVVNNALPAIDSASFTDNAAVATLENKLYIIGEKTKGELVPGKATIAGYLHDSKTGESIIGALITIGNTKTGVISDQYGYYTLTIPKGRNTLSIQSLGLRDTRRQVMVYGNGRMNIDIQQLVIPLKNVTVSSERTSLVRGMQMGVQRVDIKAIKQVPVAFGEADVLRVVLTMPGVKSVGEASTGLNVRGGSSDQNLILFNDATIFNPSHFFGLFSAFNPEVVKDLQLYKSGIPAKYGGRLSSVLEVNSREGNKKNITGTAGIGLLTSRLNIEGPLIKDKTSFIFGARTTYANWLLTLLPSEYKNSQANFNDINFNITHEINKKNNLYFTGYLSNDRFNLNNDTTYHYGNRNLSLKWKHVFNNNWYLVLAGGVDAYKYDISSEKNPITAY